VAEGEDQVKTKKVMRESKAKARLRQRLVDLAQGAMGHCVVPDGDEYIAGMAAEMGNYERFLGTSLPAINYMTTGSVYQTVIAKERNLEYKGKNVEVVPDIPLEVIRRIKAASIEANADVTIVEIGGTVGEYQNILFLEAIRMMKSESPKDIATVLVSYLPVPGSVGEMKTKPTQYAARTLNSAGVFADVIIARAPVAIDAKRREKIATFCNVRAENVIAAPDVESIYDVPLNFEKDGLSEKLCAILNMDKCSATSKLSD
jgi:CTP synthase